MKTSPQRKWTATSSYGAPLGGKRLRLAHAAIAYVGARVRAGARVRVGVGVGVCFRVRVRGRVRGRVSVWARGRVSG